MPKYSVIVPIYNTSKYLDKCLNSILSQTNQDYEILCVNDGSTDNSLEILKKYNDDIKIINQENQGLSMARNNGVKKAKGKYILFVDSDDYLEKDLLRQLDIVTKNNPDLVRFGVNEVVGESITPFRAPKFNNVNGIEAFKIITTNKYVEPAWLYLFNREFYIKNDFSFKSGVYHEDFGLIPKIIVKAETVTSIEYPGYNYVKRENSIMNDKNKIIKRTKDLLILGKDLLNVKTSSKEYYSYVANSLISASKNILIKEKKKEYINELKNLNISKYLLKNNFKRYIKYIVCKLSLNLYIKVMV